MELSFKNLDLKEVENVIKSIDFDTFLKGVFYTGNELEQIHNLLKNIANALSSIDGSLSSIDESLTDIYFQMSRNNNEKVLNNEEE